MADLRTLGGCPLSPCFTLGYTISVGQRTLCYVYVKRDGSQSLINPMDPD